MQQGKMLLIISPAKKMNVVDDSFGWRDLPRFVDRSEELLAALRGMTPDELQRLWKCSDALADLNVDRVRSADVRSGALTPAVLAYEGIQYQHIAARALSGSELAYLQNHLRILSGLYGVLRPLDGVVPYRLEMQAKLAVAGQRDLYGFWGDALCRSLAEEGSVVVNLASVEYAKAVVPWAKKAGRPRIVTCLFGSVSEAGALVQRSTAAKAARGEMVRWCAEHEVESIDDLRRFGELGYRFDPARSDDDTFVFAA